MTLRALLAAALLVGTAPSFTPAAEKDDRLYALRTTYVSPGHLDALHARFRAHAMRIFAKHGLTHIGCWVPVKNLDNRHVSIRAFPNRQARDRFEETLRADREWQRVLKQDGNIVEKRETLLLFATDYSPRVQPTQVGERVFGLYTVTAAPGRMGALHALYRDHTLRLFEKYGLTNVGYWVPARGERGADDTLIFLVAHKSVAAIKVAYDAVHSDPAWQAARKDAEEKAGGPLISAKDGVKSVFMKPTDYSPMK